MHRFSYKLDRTMRVQKNTKKILLFAMARLVNSRDGTELRIRIRIRGAPHDFSTPPSHPNPRSLKISHPSPPNYINFT